jgi:hypothetical protein
MYLSNTEPLTCLSCSLNAVFYVLHGPVPQDAETPSFCCCKFLTNLWIISIAVLENVHAAEAGLQKRVTFSTLIEAPAGPGYQTRATCVAGSGASHSAIHYHSELFPSVTYIDVFDSITFTGVSLFLLLPLFVRPLPLPFLAAADAAEDDSKDKSMMNGR